MICFRVSNDKIHITDIYLKGKGLRTESQGTAYCFYLQSELKALTEIDCQLCCKYDLNQLFVYSRFFTGFSIAYDQ